MNKLERFAGLLALTAFAALTGCGGTEEPDSGSAGGPVSNNAEADKGGIITGKSSADFVAFDQLTEFPENNRREAIFEFVLGLHGPADEPSKVASKLLPFAEFTAPKNSMVTAHEHRKDYSILTLAVPSPEAEVGEAFKKDLEGRGWKLTDEYQKGDNSGGDPRSTSLDFEKSSTILGAERISIRFTSGLQSQTATKPLQLTWPSGARNPDSFELEITNAHITHFDGLGTDELYDQLDEMEKAGIEESKVIEELAPYQEYRERRSQRFGGAEPFEIPDGVIAEEHSLETRQQSHWNQGIALTSVYFFEEPTILDMMNKVKASLDAEGIEYEDKDGSWTFEIPTEVGYQAETEISFLEKGQDDTFPNGAIRVEIEQSTSAALPPAIVSAVKELS